MADYCKRSTLVDGEKIRAAMVGPQGIVMEMDNGECIRFDNLAIEKMRISVMAYNESNKVVGEIFDHSNSTNKTEAN